MKKYIYKLSLIFILIFLISCGIEKNNLYDEHDESLVFSTIENSKIDLKKYKGKYLVVNYWATWCSPCIKELPELVKFNKMYGNKASVVGVNLEKLSYDELEQFKQKFNVSYPNFNEDIIYKILGIEVIGFPTTYIFNPKGALIKTIQGPVSTQMLAQITR